MKKLLKAYKNLPPELKMFLALAGLGTPIGAIYFLKRFFPHVSTLVLILCVGAVVAVLALLVLLITVLFSRGRKKRTNRMAAELADEAQAGPQSVDVSAAIKANNEKFFSAVRDMRKNVGISVYDLPWYIVIGDSGCGKTKLVNEGGLTFSTGKPEGYQLGTLNYNWWFTEDAIFVDMAGRLCNPQDDSDRREWSAFLDTVGKGRKGYPINGTLVCVSADHLLQDPPEKIEADANTTLERLRDLQTRLGVTFATYVIITKCDKILGFMQFFDRAERDITVKNQIFGWSKPSGFSELYDPEKFKDDFDALYARLNELRLRRLNDDAEEIDLGLAYGFPEEFRSLYEPVQIYIRTLFPYIRQPRAVKNLIFRGVYFTSATQEGELILKHITERLGQEAADQFPPLDDLYPNKRPHFIKDVLFRKVFPEQGLVFRNEQQVVRNKKLNKVLKVGTGVVTVLLIGVFWWSMAAFGRVIDKPRKDAQKVARSIGTMTPEGTLQQAGIISRDVATLEDHKLAARLLSIVPGAHKQPINDLNRIRLALVEKSLVKALTEVDEALRSGRGLRRPGTEAATAYLAAAEQYLAWYGCRAETQPPPDLTFGGFETLCGVLTGSRSSITNEEGFRENADWYFSFIQDNRKLGRNPAGLLVKAGLDPSGTVHTALGHVYDHYKRYHATLTEDHADKHVAEWMRIRGACRAVAGSYGDMLDSSVEMERIRTLAELSSFRARFLEQYSAFDGGLAALSWQAQSADSYLLRIPSLADAVWEQRQHWVGYQGRLRQAARRCGEEDSAIIAAIDALSAGGGSRKGLDRILWESLRENEIVTGPYTDAVYEAELFKKRVVEVYELFPEILTFTKGDEENGDKLEATVSARRAAGYLKAIRDDLAGVDVTVPEDLSAETPAVWIKALAAGPPSSKGEGGGIEAGELSQYWRPRDLRLLYEGRGALLSQGRRTRVLLTMLRRLEDVDRWGYVRLLPYEEISRDVEAPYTIGPPPRPPGAGPAVPTTVTTQRPTRTEPDTDIDIFARRTRRREAATAGAEEPEWRGPRSRGRVPACVTSEFLSDRAAEWVRLLYQLRGMAGSYLEESGPAGGEPLHERCIERLRRAATAYTDAYTESWSRAYREKTLRELDGIMQETSSWNSLARAVALRSTRDRIAGRFERSLARILQSTCCATYHPRADSWWDDFDRSEWWDVADWVRRSMEREWDRELGLFVYNAKLPEEPDASQYPWNRVAKEFAGQWLRVAEKVAQNAKLPKRFKGFAIGDMPSLPPIPWGEIDRLRDEYRLDDERLTGRLAAFENRAQNLLSGELSRTLYGLEQAYFGDASPAGGWPYLAGEQYTRHGLDTVDFDRFVGFLDEVNRAWEVFKDLERDLPDDVPARAERRAFYRACDRWSEFLGLAPDESDLHAKELRLVVFEEDPRTPPVLVPVDDGCQFSSRRVVLDLGAGRSPLRTGCQREDWTPDGQELMWSWGVHREGELQVSLDGLLPGVTYPGPRLLGRYSPLALCAYLERYGVSNDRRTWYVTHTFDVVRRARDGSQKKEKVGQKLRFELSRPLPEPIKKLARVAASEDRQR